VESVIFYPLAATVISAIFAATLWRQYRRKPRAYLLAWSIALAIYAVAALTEVIGAAGGWNPLLYRIYYYFGAITVVGVLAGQDWGEGEERLEPGETLVMFTDGVPDARRAGGPMFGEERLVELLSTLKGEPAVEVCERVVEAAEVFAEGDVADDVTLVVLKRNR